MLRGQVERFLRSIGTTKELKEVVLGHIADMDREKLNCSFRLGPGVSRTARFFLVSCFEGQIFVHPISEELAERYGYERDRLTFIPGGARRDLEPRAELPIGIGEPEVTRFKPTAIGFDFDGRMPFTLEGFRTEPLVLRFAYEVPGDASVQLFKHVDYPLLGSGDLDFEFQIDMRGQNDFHGLLPAFLTFCRFPDPSTSDGAYALSETRGVLLTV